MLTGLWSAYPAKLAGLSGRKGALAAGYDADIVVRQTVPSSSRRFASAHACLKAVRKMLPGVGPGCSCRHEHRAPAAPPQGDRLQGRAAARPRARHLCARGTRCGSVTMLLLCLGSCTPLIDTHPCPPCPGVQRGAVIDHDGVRRAAAQGQAVKQLGASMWWCWQTIVPFTRCNMYCNLYNVSGHDPWVITAATHARQ